MKNWLNTALGKKLVNEETKVLEKVFARLFGYYLVLIGEQELLEVANRCPIKAKFWLNNDVSTEVNIPTIHSRLDKLPIDPEYIDVIFLGHCLESVANPHEVLREVYISLRHEGLVVISGFNPWSMIGIRKLFSWYKTTGPWKESFISKPKLNDWLSLLGFEVLETGNFLYSMPVNNHKFLSKSSFLEKLGKILYSPFGGCYYVLACKRTKSLTLIKPEWSARKKLAMADLVNPSIRS